MTITPETVRADVHTWLRENWDTKFTLVEWRRRLAAAGWAAPTWPREWHGAGLPGWADDVVAEELRRASAPGVPVGAGMTLAGPTILAHGSDHLKDTFLLPTLTGHLRWCQLFSEPDAGSDLAGLTTTAVRDGDDFVVSGQKLWSTSAHHADVAMCIARTDWNATKHRGLTYFVLPMRQAGIQVRPLRQMNGYASFNEIFLSEARVPAANVVGDVGDGWRVALTTLALERRLTGLVTPEYPRDGCQAVEDARIEAEEYFSTYSWYPQRTGRTDLVIDAARASAKAHDPVIRQEIARLVALEKTSAWTAERSRQRGAAGPYASVGKLALSAVAQQAAKVHGMIAGAGATLAGPDGAAGGVIAEILLSVPAQSIAGGTDEIQRNIVGEKALGLPREPAVDRDRPYREVRRTR